MPNAPKMEQIFDYYSCGLSMSEINSENIASEQVETDEWQIDNIPNRLTILRVLLIPILIICLGSGLFEQIAADPWRKSLEWFSAMIFILASITDFFDGYIARKRKIVTVFGSFLDPIADKFLVVSSLILLLGLGRVNTIIVIILILREMYMTSLRLLAMERELKVPVNNLGKWKTTFQMIAIPMLMINDEYANIPLDLIGTICIYAASFLSLYSAAIYSMGLLGKLKEKRKQKKQAK